MFIPLILLMSDLSGTFEHLPVIGEQLKREGLSGILIGGLSRAHHLAQRNREAALALLPRKDTDVLIVDEDREDVILEDVDTLRRHTYRGNWEVDCTFSTGLRFPYWRNRHSYLDVSFPNIDDLDLQPGLHIPDEVFLNRMLARWKMVCTRFDLVAERLPHYLEDCDPIFHRGLFGAKFRRALKGDPPGVISMDSIQVRPITGHEKYCLSTGYDMDYR